MRQVLAVRPCVWKPESRPNDEIAGGVLSTVTVNGVENGLTRPETVPAVAVKRYWPSASVPGTAKSSGARRRGLLADLTCRSCRA